METTAVNLRGVAGQAPQAGEGEGATPKSPSRIIKSVYMNKTDYCVDVSDNKVEAKSTTYPLAKYANYYWDAWEVDASYSRGWARVQISGGGNGWARRGSMTEAWVDFVGYIRVGEAKKFINEIKEKLRTVEDGTPEIKEIFDRVVKFVEEIAEKNREG